MVYVFHLLLCVERYEYIFIRGLRGTDRENLITETKRYEVPNRPFVSTRFIVHSFL
jgi:hypothetical protein